MLSTSDTSLIILNFWLCVKMIFLIYWIKYLVKIKFTFFFFVFSLRLLKIFIFFNKILLFI